ncbi:telethonin-like [Pelodytes ibericus]
MDVDTKSTISFTILSCNVQEENVSKKESCTWLWDDLTMDNRPEERVTLSECDSVHKQGYEKKEQTIFIIQRSPLQTIRLGRFGGEIRDYHLPYKSVLPVPLFMPSKIQAPTSEEPLAKMKMTHSNGLCAEKREVTGLLNNLPHVMTPNKLPLRVSSLISPPPDLHDTNWH